MVGVEDKDVRGPIDWNIFTPWFSTRSVEHHATHLLPYLKDGQRIIDVGCGIGSITLDLARRTPNGYVLGVELNQGG
jgi:tRNA G46 methylase TrmB